eukprot:1082733-Amphidinium_carterae.1
MSDVLCSAPGQDADASAQSADQCSTLIALLYAGDGTIYLFLLPLFGLAPSCSCDTIPFRMSVAAQAGNMFCKMAVRSNSYPYRQPLHVDVPYARSCSFSKDFPRTLLRAHFCTIGPERINRPEMEWNQQHINYLNIFQQEG